MAKKIASIGTFDGVHRGHIFLIEELKRVAKEQGLEPLLISFSPNPIKFFKSKVENYFLLPIEQKITALKSLDIEVLILPFDHKLSVLSAEEFMLLLKEKYEVEALFMGYDQSFGREQRKDLDFYQACAEKSGLKLIQNTQYTLDGDKLSSSQIRSLIKGGNLEQANKLLGRPYRLFGQVKAGLRIGRTLGYPTANIELTDQEQILPPIGVYAVRVWHVGKAYKGMFYLGYRPSLNKDLSLTLEVNLFDFTGDLYGEELDLELLSHIRGEMTFDNLSALKEQISQDEREVKKRLP